jgi:hypothetical protein
MWETILKSAIALSGPSYSSSFTRAEILSEAQRVDPSHPSHSYSAMFQTMVAEAPGRSMAPVGKVFRRLDRSTYLLAWDALPERWRLGRDQKLFAGTDESPVSSDEIRPHSPSFVRDRSSAVDFRANLSTFLEKRSPGDRYASFDYCFNHFQCAREEGRLDQLNHGDELLSSCLHLGFYLSSWGMMRGSGGLMKQSIREMIPVVRSLVAEPPPIWALDLPDYASNSGEVMDLIRRTRQAFSFGASDTLVTKTLLGVMGCVPAFDRFFRDGFGVSTLGRGSLARIGRYFDENRALFDDVWLPTLDFATGEETTRFYTDAKVMDMVFFQEGLSRSGE